MTVKTDSTFKVQLSIEAKNSIFYRASRESCLTVVAVLCTVNSIWRNAPYRAHGPSLWHVLVYIIFLRPETSCCVNFSR